MKSNQIDIKREKKKSLFFRELSVLIHKITVSEPDVAAVYISRVDLSADSGIIYVYFASMREPSKELFEKALAKLKLYKPSIRKALAQSLQSRYTPNLLFLFDENAEKVRNINELLDKAQKELESAEPEE